MFWSEKRRDVRSTRTLYRMGMRDTNRCAMCRYYHNLQRPAHIHIWAVAQKNTHCVSLNIHTPTLTHSYTYALLYTDTDIGTDTYRHSLSLRHKHTDTCRLSNTRTNTHTISHMDTDTHVPMSAFCRGETRQQMTALQRRASRSHVSDSRLPSACVRLPPSMIKALQRRNHQR